MGPSGQMAEIQLYVYVCIETAGDASAARKRTAAPISDVRRGIYDQFSRC